MARAKADNGYGDGADALKNWRQDSPTESWRRAYNKKNSARMSQDDLCQDKLGGINRVTYAKWLTGLNPPGPDSWPHIAKLLGVTVPTAQRRWREWRSRRPDVW